MHNYKKKNYGAKKTIKRLSLHPNFIFLRKSESNRRAGEHKPEGGGV